MGGKMRHPLTTRHCCKMECILSFPKKEKHSSSSGASGERNIEDGGKGVSKMVFREEYLRCCKEKVM